ncbi:MAG: FG-GAP-like repeat-containing protein [Planctomycetota bacterium]
MRSTLTHIIAISLAAVLPVTGLAAAEPLPPATHTTATPAPGPWFAPDGWAFSLDGEGWDARLPTIVENWLYPISAPALSAPRIADLDGDGVKDIILSTYYTGANPYAGGFVHALDINGNALPGWPKDITPGPFPGSPAVADLDNNGDMEVIVGNWYRAFVWNHDGTDFPGWPQSIGTYNSPAVADVDNDGDLEIIYTSTSKRLYVWHHDGSTLPGWPYLSAQLIGDPAVGDIDGDGDLEIAGATYQGPTGPDPFEVYVWELNGTVATGFPVATSGIAKAPVALGDVDADGQVEIVACAYDTSNNDYLYVWDAQGNLETGWPVQATYIRLSGPALGDLDADGDLEILIGGAQPSPLMEKIYAYHHDGTSVTGWPVVLTHPGAAGNVNSSPVIADVDGDNQPEVFLKTHDHLFALHADGTLVEGFPYYLSDENHTGTTTPTPAVADCDNDGDVEFVHVSNFGTVAFFDQPGGFSPNDAYWPMYKHDARGTSFMPLPGKGDMNCDGNVNAYDIDGFICAVSPECDYEGMYPDCDRMLADCNGDGDVNSYDIDSFIALVGGG